MESPLTSAGALVAGLFDDLLAQVGDGGLCDAVLKGHTEDGADLTLPLGVVADKVTARLLQINDIDHPAVGAIKPPPDLGQSVQDPAGVPDTELGHAGRKDLGIAETLEVTHQGVFQVGLHQGLHLGEVGGAPVGGDLPLGTEGGEGLSVLLCGVGGGEVQGVIQYGRDQKAGGGGGHPILQSLRCPFPIDQGSGGADELNASAVSDALLPVGFKAHVVVVDLADTVKRNRILDVVGIRHVHDDVAGVPFSEVGRQSPQNLSVLGKGRGDAVIGGGIGVGQSLVALQPQKLGHGHGAGVGVDVQIGGAGCHEDGGCIVVLFHAYHPMTVKNQALRGCRGFI